MSIKDPGLIGRSGGGAAGSNRGGGAAGTLAARGVSDAASIFVGAAGAGAAWGAALPSAAVKKARWAAIASALRARAGAVGGEGGAVGGMGGMD
jgi:hypothetical protein